MIGNLRTYVHSFARREEGAFLIEFALVVPIMFFLVFGLIDFARLGLANVMADKATETAVRMATVRPVVCPNVPRIVNRGLAGTLSLDLPNGTSCTARSGLCVNSGTISCTASLSNATAAAIWERVSPMMPTGAQPDNLRLSYTFDANLNRVGAAYAPIISVEIVDLLFDFISPLGALADLAAGTSNSTLGQSFTFASMSASLPSEDLR
ncbi:TadE/TadG family type IV pilus assembly protein [Roseovarius arcticus]|uniref:TadE/TadG family type IV pilus assembly protein n=1 Tax=Roseovarius arcticus TaxID=2547404 RepID=UPI001110D576|nr:TadE/TadG family type IV pilus assembly protein [Roseovarius arcticus]